ncbi:MAG: c-type cytochrome domain-containing protein [Planctomycetota bacterium]|jgi:mono/diheme cytochrome c family protein
MRQSLQLPLAIVALLGLVPVAVSVAFDEKDGDKAPAVKTDDAPVGPIDFERQILPLLQESCFECHSAKAKKPKSGLRLDGKNWILTGGEKEGPAVRAGEPGRSPLYERAGKYYEDEGVMPPDGDIYEKTELKLIRHWILQGAKFGEWMGEGGIDAPEPDRNDLIPAPPSPFKAYLRIGEDLAMASTESIQALRGAQVLVSSLYPGSPLLRVEFVQRRQNVDDALLSVLAALRENVGVLALRDAKITDKAMEEIGRLPNLVNLDLRGTAITDEGLKILARTPLQELATLSLEGTAVTDKGLAHLVAHPKLHTLTIRGAKTTEAGADRLGKRLPNCRIYWKPKRPKIGKKQAAAGAEDAKK